MIKKIINKIGVYSKEEKGYTSIFDNVQFLRLKQMMSIMKNRNLNKKCKQKKLKRVFNNLELDKFFFL